VRQNPAGPISILPVLRREGSRRVHRVRPQDSADVELLRVLRNGPLKKSIDGVAAARPVLTYAYSTLRSGARGALSLELFERAAFPQRGNSLRKWMALTDVSEMFVAYPWE
jgi:hypothetical protein